MSWQEFLKVAYNKQSDYTNEIKPLIENEVANCKSDVKLHITCYASKAYRKYKEKIKKVG